MLFLFMLNNGILLRVREKKNMIDYIQKVLIILNFLLYIKKLKVLNNLFV
jgi:hypothetical protein